MRRAPRHQTRKRSRRADPTRLCPPRPLTANAVRALLRIRLGHCSEQGGRTDQGGGKKSERQKNFERSHVNFSFRYTTSQRGVERLKRLGVNDLVRRTLSACMIVTAVSSINM